MIKKRQFRNCLDRVLLLGLLVLVQTSTAPHSFAANKQKGKLAKLSIDLKQSSIVLPSFPKDVESSFHQHVLRDLVMMKDPMDSLQGKVTDLEKKKEKRAQTLSDDVYSQNQDYVQGQEAMGSYFRTVIKSRVLGFFRKANRALRAGDQERRREQEKLDEVNPHYSVKYAAEYKARKKKQASGGAPSQPMLVESRAAEGVSFVGVMQEFWQFSADVVERKKEISLLGGSKAFLHYEVPENTFYFSLESPLFNSNLRHRVSNQPLPFSGSAAFVGDTTAVDISRDIPIFELSTGLSYGVNSKTLGYGVSRQIIGPLNAQVSRTSNLSQNLPTDTVLRLNLGFGF